MNARNGEIIAASEGYTTKEGCLNGIRAVQSSCNAEIEDLSVTQTPTPVETKVTSATTISETAEPIVETKGASVSAVTETVASIVGMAESKVEAVPASVGNAMPSVEMCETTLVLNQLPESVTKGEILFFKGKLSRCDNGEGIPNAKISIREHDRSYLLDEVLEVAYTKEDGSFENRWKARTADFWDNTDEFYAQ